MVNLLLLLLIIITNISLAHSFNLDDNSSVVGAIKKMTILNNHVNGSYLAFDLGLGFTELKEANPDIEFEKSNFLPTNINRHIVVYDLEYLEDSESNSRSNLATNKKRQLIIPTKYILPNTERMGVVINLSEYRLYFYPENENRVYTFPIGIGREEHRTPLMETKIISKRTNPIWIPTANIREEELIKGIYLPNIVMPGPENPLGEYALRLGYKNEEGLYLYLIHGTNNLAGIGLHSSAGCIRMYPEDAKLLFSLVEINTKVKVIDQPIKIGMKDDKLYLEVHIMDPDRDLGTNYHKILTDVNEIVLPVTKENSIAIDWEALIKVIVRNSGIPEVIGELSLND